MKERIKKIRKELDLTQQEFADKIGVKRGAIANYEVGRNEPTDSVVSLICREFNIREEWLRNGTGEMFIERSRDEQITNFINDILSNEKATFKKRLISVLSALGESEWEVLEQIAINIVEQKEDTSTKSQSYISPVLNAAHERTDIKLTKEGKIHDDAIMDDDSEWE